MRAPNGWVVLFLFPGLILAGLFPLICGRIVDGEAPERIHWWDVVVCLGFSLFYRGLGWV